ncbi:MAG: hypothetical protein J0647_10660, partial [Campylobacteraceae bacterium]|nr:hypothetical protein [Campylobacteraceae bacterium]
NTAKKIKITEISTEVLNKNAQEIGEKTFFNLPNNIFLSEWLPRFKTDCINIPLKNAIHPQMAKAKVSAWVSTAIGYLWSAGNDLQQSSQHTCMFSSCFSNGCGYYISPENLWQAAIVFSVRQLIQHTWINHNDQFLQPTQPLSDEFKNDCLIWMLFHGKNLSASANELEWNGIKWSIVNHFIPFSEAEVDSPERFESDFMVEYLRSKKLSLEATAVLDAGRVLWKAYFSHIDVRTVRDEFKLNRPDVGWYQIRNALKARNASGDTIPVDFSLFEKAYKTLGDKLRPCVYEL